MNISNMEQLFYWLGGIIIVIIGYFLRGTMEDIKENKRHTDMEIERLKENSAANKAKIDVLESESNLKYSHLNQKLDELYAMLRDLIIEVKDINKRIK
jgi:non-ribosomal peptide synthetase component E (peptide arylation enzyme)